MARVPDEAILNRRQISHGAYWVYEVYCMFRNSHKNDVDFGLSYPGMQTIEVITQYKRTHISDMTGELIKEGWIEKQGWKVRPLMGFEKELAESKCRNLPTTASDNEGYGMSESSDNSKLPVSKQSGSRYQMQMSEISDNLEIPESDSDDSNCRNSAPQLSELFSQMSEKKSQLSEFRPEHIRKLEPVEPKEPDKPEKKARASPKKRTPKKRPKKPELNDAEWLKSLEENPENAGKNTRRLYAKMLIWCADNGETPTRKRFEVWLRKEKVVGFLPGMEIELNGNGAKRNGTNYRDTMREFEERTRRRAGIGPGESDPAVPDVEDASALLH